MSHLYKRLDSEAVRAVLARYADRSIASKEARTLLSLGKTQFFDLAKRYRENPQLFTIVPPERRAHRRIPQEADDAILNELKREKELIENKHMPIHTYNYSAVRDTLVEKNGISVSLSTVIARAKEHGFYVPKPEKKIHDRVVLTSFAGELVQHDSSHHLWSPYMEEKLYLITSLDDYTRKLLFADLFPEETAWRHIEAAESVVVSHGAPLKYYADSHSIFRYVKDRDTESNWKHYSAFTDDVDTQWKRALKQCSIDVVYALSPQAKGKIERPYRWLQDRIVRTAAKEKLTTISELRDVLRRLVDSYNNAWVHSTTGEIPQVRFENALNENRCLFRPLARVAPGADPRDIFCLRFSRKTDGYRRVSFDGMRFDLPDAAAYKEIEIHVTPQETTETVLLRFWQDTKLVGERRATLSSLRSVRF